MLSVTCVVFFAASVYSFHVNLENNVVAESSISGDLKVDRLRRGAVEIGGLEEAADEVDVYGDENAVQVRQKRYEIKEDAVEGKNDDTFPIRPRFGFFGGDPHGPRYPHHRGYPGQGHYGFPQHGPPHHRRPHEPHGYHRHGYPHRHHPRPDCHGGYSKEGSDEYDYDNYDNNYKSSTTQPTRGTTTTSAPSTAPTTVPTTASTTTPTTTTPYPLIDVRSGE